MLIHNPIKKGHILICPKSNVNKFRDMDPREVFELSLAIKLVTQGMQEYYKKQPDPISFTISIQEG